MVDIANTWSTTPTQFLPGSGVNTRSEIASGPMLVCSKILLFLSLPPAGKLVMSFILWCLRPATDKINMVSMTTLFQPQVTPFAFNKL